jgi:nucleotide-binding universal stress UspA family protein
VLEAEKQKSLSNAKDLLHALETAAKKAGLHFHTILEEAMLDEISDAAIRHARLRDLTIVSTNDPELADAGAEDLLFESGRPILVPPRDLKRGDAPSLDNIAVAWDSSRVATRAISDAVPLLRLAKHVHVLTVVNEKALPAAPLHAELAAHLGRHGIEASMENVDARGRAIAEVLRAYVEAKDIGMLVMGGYGHSRLKEFILGGATKAVLDRPFQWTFLSH